MSSVLISTRCFSGGAIVFEVDIPNWFHDPEDPAEAVILGPGPGEHRLVPWEPLVTFSGVSLWSHVANPYRQKAVFLQDLGDKRLSVRRPIAVSLEFWEGLVTACCYDLEEFEIAEDEFTAVEELKASIADLYFVLKSEKKNLGPLPQRQWDYLRETLKER